MPAPSMSQYAPECRVYSAFAHSQKAPYVPHLAGVAVFGSVGSPGDDLFTASVK